MSQNDPQCTVDFEHARTEETKRIQERRRLLNLEEENVDDDLFGVSLSGGGLRSAYFSLGIVHAFYHHNIWRHVDYLSTVSGGSYIGSWLSSRVIKRRPRVDPNCDEAPTPLSDDFEESGPRVDDRVKPEAVHWFSGRGKYLIRATELGNKYLIGLFFVNLLVVSGIMTAAAFTAFLWRCLDYPFVRDRFSVLGIRGDTVTPFVPLIIFVLLWLVSWSISYWRRGAEAPGLYAKRLLILSLLSAGVGVAILLGNGDIAMLSGGEVELSNRWLTGALGLFSAALLPLLNPKRLLQSSLRPQSWWEKLVFSVVTLVLLVGVPLAFVGMFAQENISGFNTDPERPVVLGDIDEDLAFVAMLKGVKSDIFDLTAQTKLTADPVEKLLDGLEGKKDRQKELEKNSTGDSDSVPANTAEDRSNSADKEREQGDKKQLEEQQKRKLDFYLGIAAELRELEKEGVLPSSFKTVRRIAEHSRMAQLGAAEANRELERFSSPVADYTNRLYQYVGSLDQSSIGINAVARFRAYQDSAEGITSYLCFVVDQTMLKNRKFLELQASQWKEINGWEEVVAAMTDGSDANTGEITKGKIATANNTLPQPSNRGDGRDENERKKAKASIENWLASLARQNTKLAKLNVSDIKRANRRFLEDLHPNVFRSRKHVRRKISIYADQSSRFAWFLVSGLVFLLAATFVDFNATTMHGYYRNRLSKAFLNPVNMSSDYPMYPTISELRTTEYGAPYHLISCSVRTMLEPKKDTDEKAMPQITPFIFSQLFCGSEETGYLPSDQYERYVRGEFNRLDIAEAAAISGAAVSPSVSPNWLTSVFMFIMNLRTGQWLPNPRYGRPRLRPVVWMLWKKLYGQKEMPYLFSSDGGHSENLGLLQLLKRRCKVIVAIDAGHDPKHDFFDLARVVRLAHARHGITIRTRWDKEAPYELDATPLRLSAERKRQLLEAERGQNLKDCDDHFIVADIEYPDEGRKGLLVYIKPSLTGDEDLAVQEYRSRSVEFPHESTGDQIYEDCQIEAYRKLGFHIGTQVAERLFATDGKLQREVYENLDRAISAQAKRNSFKNAGSDAAKDTDVDSSPGDAEDEFLRPEFDTETSDSRTRRNAATTDFGDSSLVGNEESATQRAATVAVLAEVESVAQDMQRPTEERLKLLRNARAQLEDSAVLGADLEPLIENLLKIAEEKNFASLRVEAITWLPHVASRKNKRVKRMLESLTSDGRHKKVEKAAVEALEKMALPRR